MQIDEHLSIPRNELRFRFSRSSGPGGQHVQKSDTRVELLYDVAGSPSLSDAQRALVFERLAGYIGADGMLRVVSQSERSQWRNRREVTQRFQELMRAALKQRRKRRPTRPSRAAKERRLREKRRRSQTKELRRDVRMDD
jgi:ribosome-associated protein